ncbi:hypothetical protein N1851_012509 [Merluccius polli]|uniref:Integrase core domain-containing protein n=1 Tax=Merluccius polli TaxID=89951 RepID=A0AA47MXD0_MERPO|nr:hypothetical protein N1851_022104 [Merluccius polli]KAK0147819.1 hypothetical protein N1851_012509 [Merluccius polli]
MEYIEEYFRRGFTTNEMFDLLAVSHGVILSKRTLERCLSKKRFWRRKNKTDVVEVAAFIEQLESAGQCQGYRWMHQKCWLNGIVTDRETVRILLRLLDGEGVDLRSRNRLRRRVYHSCGPNYVWHIDGYDKLKPFGIAISGCIDGFSRKMIWVEAYKTNNDPKVIAGYFTDAVVNAGGCLPELDLLWGQKMAIASSQNTDSAIFGPSTGNQRIEQWWLTLRNNFLDKSVIQFCFLQTIQEDINGIVSTWNDHRIRQVHNSRSPHGRPSILHAVPQLYGGRDYLQNVDLEKVEVCLEECVFKDFPCDEDVFYICVDLMSEHNLTLTNVFETVNLDITLRQLINNDLGINH